MSEAKPRVTCETCGKDWVAKADGTPRKHTCIPKPVTTRCSGCDQDVPAREDGSVSYHTTPGDYMTGCPGADTLGPLYKPTQADAEAPADPFALPASVDQAVHQIQSDGGRKGPWFGAMYSGELFCGHRVEEGDMIRADGEGGYECEEWCGQDDPAPEPVADPFMDNLTAAGLVVPGDPAETHRRMLAGKPCHNGPGCRYCHPAPEPGRLHLTPETTLADAQRAVMAEISADLFSVPTPAPVAAPQVSKYTARGQYAIKDPTLGDYRRHKKGTIKGVTRVTTFVKAATDSMALNDWGKRNILIGAAKRPDIAAQAVGMTHEDHKVQLNKIAEELAKEAGAKVSAEYGTTVHKLTEQVDSGVIALAQVPDTFRKPVELYLQCLEDEGLVVVPGLIERSVFVDAYGGVAGTFDRIYLHKASGQYVMGDVKSGKTLDYGMNEIEAQLALYEMGFNAFGVYDWHRQEWTPRITGHDGKAIRVHESVGVVIHMPFQGPDAGKVRAVKANLLRGRAYARLCGDVRGFEKAKPEPWEGLPWPTQSARPTWEERFARVQTREEARELYDAAVAVGDSSQAQLARYVELARAALLSRG